MFRGARREGMDVPLLLTENVSSTSEGVMGPSVPGLQGSMQYKRFYKVQTASFEMKDQCLNISQHRVLDASNTSNKQQDPALSI